MWITLAATDLSSHLSEAERTGLPVSLPDGSTVASMLGVILSQVTLMVRARVGAYHSNTLGADGTIPDELKSTALTIVRSNLLTRVDMPVSQDRERETSEAYDTLKAVARGEFAIVAPETVSDSQPAGPSITVAVYTPRVASRTSLAGL